MIPFTARTFNKVIPLVLASDLMMQNHIIAITLTSVFDAKAAENHKVYLVNF